MAQLNPLLDEIERWQIIHDWFEQRPDWHDERAKVEGFIRRMIAATNLASPSTPTEPNQ